MANIADFKSQLIGGGARSNQFRVYLHFPSYVSTGALEGARAQFLCKTAQLPGSTIGTVTQNYFGREVKFAGNRTFADWTITIINDENFVIRNAFERWLSLINSHAGNLRLTAPSPDAYTSRATVKQFGKSSPVAIKTYDFVGMFPTDLSTIDLNWGDTDSMEEFTEIGRAHV